MTKTIAKIAARCEVKSGEAGMMPLDAKADGLFVWIFEFGSRAAQALAPRVGICLSPPWRDLFAAMHYSSPVFSLRV